MTNHELGLLATSLQPDLADGTLFGNDAGEDELPEVLASYFVDQPAFKNFLAETTRFQIARSRKGMGKSALLSKLAHDLKKKDEAPIVVTVTGADLLGILAPSSYDPLPLQNYWKQVICSRINAEIGKNVGFAFSDTAMSLVENSEIAGLKGRNIVGSLISRIKSSSIPIEVMNPKVGNHEELLKRALVEFGDRNVWVLIDDIDSTYIDSPDTQSLTSTFFSACRALARNSEKLNIRVSVRSDVWSNLRKNEDLDKCEQYVTDISWTSKELKYILSKKIYSYFVRSNSEEFHKLSLDYIKDADELLEFAFTARMQWGKSRVGPFQPIQILSAGRPRWMSQLCRLAGQEADKHGSKLIGIQQINAVTKKYSRFRINDIYKEHSHQFSDLQNLIEAFSNGGSRFSTKELLAAINNNYVSAVGSSNVPEIDNLPYKSPLQLAHFIFKVGFVVGRKENIGNANLADFVRFEERPELLTNNKNSDDGLEWEIHPSYRDAISIKNAAKARADRAKPRAPRPPRIG